MLFVVSAGKVDLLVPSSFYIIFVVAYYSIGEDGCGGVHTHQAGAHGGL